MTILEIPFSRQTGFPDHAKLAVAFRAAVVAVTGADINPVPSIQRINEDYGSRQEEIYSYCGAKLSLHAHAVGLMSGHGRHGTRTSWRGEGVEVVG